MSRAAGWVLLVLLAAACGDDEPATMTLELAPWAEELAGRGETCSAESDVEPAAFPMDVELVHLMICSADVGSCAEAGSSFPLAAPAEPHDETMTRGAFVDVDGFQIDAKLGPAPHRVEAVACKGGEVFARGFAHGVNVGGGEVTIRLYRDDAVSCAGLRREGRMPDARALHAMTRMRNGDILIYGGVRGTAARAPGPTAEGITAWRGLQLQPSVEVYRPSVERFLPVALSGPDPTPGGFSRVLFASGLLPPHPDDALTQDRIRVVGGLTRADGSPAETSIVRFDSTQGRTFLGAPLVPHPEAILGPTVDLVYDPAALTLRIVQMTAPTIAVPSAAANALVPPTGVAPGIVALGFRDEFYTDLMAPGWNTPMRGPPNAPVPEPTYWFMDDGGQPVDGTSTMLLAGRFGHSLTRLAGGSALVWGGNVFTGDITSVQSLAGEALVPGSPSQAVAAVEPDGALPPAAFHSATKIADNQVLVSGGLAVGAAGFTTTLATPIWVLRYDGGGAASRVAVGGTVEPTFLHSATAIGPSDAPERVFVTGGTGAGAGGGTVVSRAFDVSRQVVQVTPDGLGGWVAGPPFLTGAQLITGRWGHASVELPNDRVLVTGGLAPVADDANQIQAIDRAEVVVYGRAAMWNPCPASLIDGGVAELPTGVDAGPPDPDAGDPDGGVAAMDAGF